MKITKQYLVSLGEKMATVALGAFLGAFQLANMSSAKAGVAAAGSAVIAFLIGVAAKFVGNPDSANLSTPSAPGA